MAYNDYNSDRSVLEGGDPFSIDWDEEQRRRTGSEIFTTPGDIRSPNVISGQPPSPSSTTAASWQSDPRGWFEGIRQGLAPGSESLVGLKDKLGAAGWRLENPNAQGVTSKIIDPSGNIYRVGGYFDSAPSEGLAKEWTWVQQPTGGGRDSSSGNFGRADIGGGTSWQNYMNQLPPGAQAAPAMAPVSQRDPAWDALYNQLLQRSQQSLNVTGDEPVIKSQVDALRAQANRDRTQQLKEAAERGGPYATGALANEARISGENIGLQAGSLRARLMGDEIMARREEIRDALSGAQGMVSAAEMVRLREEDQQLARRAQEIGVGQQGFENAMNRFITARNAGQQDWENLFRDRGWWEDVSQQNLQNDYSQLFG